MTSTLNQVSPAAQVEAGHGLACLAGPNHLLDDLNSGLRQVEGWSSVDLDLHSALWENDPFQTDMKVKLSF